MQLSRSLIARIVAFLSLALNQADPVFLTPVTHQITQFTDREARYLMHADEQRRTDWQAPVADLAQQGRCDFQQAGQGNVVFKSELFNERVEQVVGIVGIGRSGCTTRGDN
jgi:hypothetical protein